MKNPTRTYNRNPDEIRPVTITSDYLDYPDGSVLIEMGKTRVLCVASIQEEIPRWMKDQGVKGGWITSEYSMMPYAAGDRMHREVTRGKIGGRTHEIQRLVGRSLRAAVDLNALGTRTIWIDCDVLQADGGTRTAAITGSFVCLIQALQQLKKKQKLSYIPVKEYVGAISTGIVKGIPLLDLSYDEDVAAEVDMNFVMTDSGDFVEIQGTAEEKPFSQDDFATMKTLAEKGIKELIDIQKQHISLT